MSTLSEAMLPPMFTTTSGTTTDGAPISSRPAATTSLFGSASSQRASQRAADEDACDDGQDPQYLLPSSQDETETRRDQSSKTYTWRTQSRHTKNGWGVEGKLDDINVYLNPTIHIHSSLDSNPTPPVQPPSHAQRWTKGQGNGSENGQKRGRVP